MLRAVVVATFVIALAITTWATPALARPCATMALLSWSRHGGPQLDVGFGERPAADDIRATFDSASAGHALRVHAGIGVTDERAQQVLAFLDDAWEQQIAVAGFAPPLPDDGAGGNDALDVYVVPLSPGLGGVTVAGPDASPRDGKHASASFLLLDPTLADDLLEVYAHHEFQHALQFALDVDEAVMWFESTAVFWEVRARPDVTDWHASLPDFQQSPQLPLFADGARAAGVSLRPAARYEYGAVLFALYLDEVHGDGQGALLRTLWEGSAQPDLADANEPDFVDALVTQGFDVGELLAEFTAWRTLVGPLAVTGDGPTEELPGTAALFAGQLNAATLDGTPITTDEAEGPFALGCIVRQVRAPANVAAMPVVIQAGATLPQQQLRMGIMVMNPEAPADVEQRFTEPSATVADVASVPTNHLLQIAVCDVTVADPDAAFEPRPITLSVLRTDVSFPDAGPEVVDAGQGGDDEPPVVEDPGCGCQSTGASASPMQMRSVIGGLALVLGLVGFGVRAVRHVKRRALYRRREPPRAP